MRRDKLNRAIQAYNGFKGNATVAHIMSTIPTDLQNKLTGTQLGTVMTIRNNAFRDGKAAAIKEIEEFIGLPNGVSIWDVIGDEIPDLLESKGQAVKKQKESQGEIG